jgi:hypothetical protein
VRRIDCVFVVRLFDGMTILCPLDEGGRHKAAIDLLLANSGMIATVKASNGTAARTGRLRGGMARGAKTRRSKSANEKADFAFIDLQGYGSEPIIRGFPSESG